MARSKRDIVEYRIYDLPVHLPILCLTGDVWRISDSPSERLHFHNCLEIGFCHSDSGYIRFEDETVRFSAGDVFFIPRHVPHTTCSDKGRRSRWSYLFADLDALAYGAGGSMQDMPKNVTSSLGKYLRVTAASDGSRLHFLANCLLQETMVKPTAGRNQLLRVYALATIAELYHHHLQSIQPVAKASKIFPLRPALEYIHEHYMEPCDTGTLADMCHLSQTHFRRLFLACMDATPLQFVISTRIYQACQPLTNTNEPVLTIAQAVGMPSASSFNRNFMQVIGMSPRQYRTTHASTSAARRAGQVLPFKGWTQPDR
jgi:AraC-like DNA-binding protein